MQICVNSAVASIQVDAYMCHKEVAQLNRPQNLSYARLFIHLNHSTVK